MMVVVVWSFLAFVWVLVLVVLMVGCVFVSFIFSGLWWWCGFEGGEC